MIGYFGFWGGLVCFLAIGWLGLVCRFGADWLLVVHRMICVCLGDDVFIYLPFIFFLFVLLLLVI